MIKGCVQMIFHKTTGDAAQIVSFEIVTLRTSGMRYTGETEIVMKDGKAEVSQYGIRYTQKDGKHLLPVLSIHIIRF